MIDAYAQALQTVFVYTVPVAVFGFVVALFLKQVRLRDSARAGSTDMGDGFGSPATASGDSAKLLELAVGKLVRNMGAETARGIVEGSDTRLDIAGAWAVMQVDLLTRTIGHAGIGVIAGRRSLPPEVLVPVYERMEDEGFLSREGSFFTLTAAGQREADVISKAWAEWLKDQLEKDRGRPRSAELRVAADAIAKRLLAEDLGEGNFAPKVVVRH